MGLSNDLTTDTVFVRKKSGERTGPLNANVHRRTIRIFDADVDPKPGDIIERMLPNKRREEFEAEQVDFISGFEPGDAHYEVKVRKPSDPPQQSHGASINIGTATGVQIGDYNTQTVVGALQALVQQIEDSDATEDEKEEAKSRLRAFLEDPLVRTVLGAAISGVIASL